MQNGLQQEEKEGSRRNGRRAGRDKGDKGRPVEARNTRTRNHTQREEKKTITIKIASFTLMHRRSIATPSGCLPE